MLHRRTEGNPLFMVNLLEHWIAYDWLSQEHRRWMLRSGWEAIAREIPPTLRELVMQGQREAGLAQLQQGIAAVLAQGKCWYSPSVWSS